MVSTNAVTGAVTAVTAATAVTGCKFTQLGPTNQTIGKKIMDSKDVSA